MRKVRSRRLRRLGLGLVALTCLWFASGVVAGSLLTRRAHPAFAEPPPPGYVDLRLDTDDGLEIGAWLATRPSDDVAVVIAHGNGSSRSALLEEANDLRARGCTVMPISLRAHGDSSGKHNDIGWSARHDISAAVAYLRAQESERPVVVLGTSLGAAAAIFAGAEDHAPIDAYILVGVFADLRGAVRRRTTRYLPRPFSWLAYGALLAAAPIVLPELDAIAPAQSAAALPEHARALLFVGALDDRAPLSDANAVASRMRHARIVTVDGIGHDELGDVVHRPGWGPAVDALLAVIRRGHMAGENAVDGLGGGR